MKKILLVDDDDYFRSGVKVVLSKKYQVVEAPNGLVAKEILSFSQVDLVLADIRMPYMSGLELLGWVKENKPPLPVILLTGFATILETQKAYELGATDFLPKPFGYKELVEKVDLIFGDPGPAPKALTEKDLDKEFCKLPIEDFVGEKENAFSVYMRVGEAKYIKIAYKSGKIPEEKLRIFRERGVTHLYVRLEDQTP